MTLTASCYTTIAITVERFLSIRHPFIIQKHNIKAKRFIWPVAVSDSMLESEGMRVGKGEDPSTSHVQNKPVNEVVAVDPRHPLQHTPVLRVEDGDRLQLGQSDELQHQPE